MYRKIGLIGLAAMLGVAYAMADDGGGGAASAETETGPASVSLEFALAHLDPADDSVWTQSGDPLLDHLKELTGEPVSRDDVDEITYGLKRSDDWQAEIGKILGEPAEPEAPPPVADVSHQQDSPDKSEREPDPVLARKSSIDSGIYVANERARSAGPGLVVDLIDTNGYRSPATIVAHFGNGECDIDQDGVLFTGVQHKSIVDQLPADDPLRNLPRWEFTGV